MPKFKGRLDNAPVVYVLCQIRFSPVEKMVDYIPEIQEAFRSQYPNFEREQLSGMKFAPSAQPVLLQNEIRWRFESRDARTGFVLSTNQLITHTTHYLDSDDFRGRVVFGFRTVQQIAKLSFIQRIGLRYIDLITAGANDAVENYIDQSLIGFRPSVPGLAPDVSQQFLRAKSTVRGLPGTILVKASRARHANALPNDLLPISLELKRTPTAEQESIFLDWDHYIEPKDLDPDPEVLAATLQELKAPITDLFEAAITPHAVKRWQ